MKKYILPLLLAGVVSVVAPEALAHERDVFRIGNTQYLFVVGSISEPVYVDDKTGVDLRIKIADPLKPSDSASPNAKPVEGLEKTLKVELQAGDKKKVLNLEPAYKDPGAYKAPFFPTVATTYAYRVFGTIDGTDVDMTFTCNPAGHPASPEETNEVKLSDSVTRTFRAGSFGCPKPKFDAGFPEPSRALVEPQKGSRDTTALGLAVASLVIAGVALVKKSKA